MRCFRDGRESITDRHLDHFIGKENDVELAHGFVVGDFHRAFFPGRLNNNRDAVLDNPFPFVIKYGYVILLPLDGDFQAGTPFLGDDDAADYSPPPPCAGTSSMPPSPLTTTETIFLSV